MTAISMAVAAIPEGLPAVVTIALAIGAKAIFEQKSLVRRLPAVEILGSVTVICSDKTGTLTQNQMTVTEFILPEGTFSVDALEKHAAQRSPSVRFLALAGILCNDAAAEKDNTGEWRMLGDPTEGSLIVAANRLGLAPAAFVRTEEIPFDSERKRMTTRHPFSDEVTAHVDSSIMEKLSTPATPDGDIAFAKGAVDGLIEITTHILTPTGVEPLNEENRLLILHRNEELATQGIRVLGCCFQRLTATQPLQESGLTYIGMAAMIDPARPEARDAVAECKQAGIKPVMITGDHPLTDSAIAKELGILIDTAALTGAELETMSDQELRERVLDISVYFAPLLSLGWSWEEHSWLPWLFF